MLRQESWTGSTLKPIERPESLTESAVKRLRDAIVSGDFELGQPLSERQLAEMLEISKTPVREALAQLRREGLVRILPQRGAFVFTLSQQEVVEICEIRQALEASALKAAMERNARSFATAAVAGSCGDEATMPESAEGGGALEEAASRRTRRADESGCMRGL